MIGLLLAQAATQARERKFEWGNLPAPWIVFLVVLPLVVLFVSFIYRRERPSGLGASGASGAGAGGAGAGPARIVLGILRALAIIAVLAMLARPLIREIVYQTHDPDLIVLCDDSLSMRLEDRYADRTFPQRIGQLLGANPESVERLFRYDLVRRLLGDQGSRFLESLRERANVTLWTFAGGLKKIRDLPRKGSGPEALAAGEPLPAYDQVQSEERVKQTRLGDALLETVSTGKAGGKGDPDIAGVILFSDGQENSGTITAEEAARKLGQRGIPVYAVGVGNPESPKDIRVISLDASDVVIAGDVVPFDAVVAAEGYEGERVRVELFFDDELVDTSYLNLEGKGQRQSVRLQHSPRKPGDSRARVRVEVQPGELLEENNIAQKDIRVLDQKIKVLYLEGPPRWEYRFLKNTLIRDPTMEVQVLLYSADESFIQESSPGIDPLKTFPSRREELFLYHVVIIGDVDPNDLAPQQMELLRDFVSEAGGGVLFIAGKNANPARYLHTPLYAILPVEVPQEARGNWPVTRNNFNLQLTGVGKEHPVMRLDNDPDRNLELWQNDDGQEDRHLPPFLPWYAETVREKSGAVKLAIHPKDAHPVYGSRVVMAFQNLGKGRSFFSGVDDTWRWRAGVENRYLYRFWGQVIRFLASGRLLGKTQRLQITTDKPAYTIGDRIAIDCRVYDANMKPLTDETITIFHQVEAGGEAGRKPPEPLTLTLSRVKGPGSYEGVLNASQLGRHEVWIGTESERLAVKGFSVEVPALEFRDTRMDRERLKKIAELSGGKYHEFYDASSLIKEIGGITKQRQTPTDDRQDDLWDNSTVLLILVGLLTAEWIYRKMVKLQ